MRWRACRLPAPFCVKVAVLIPLYNHERYIHAALASLRAQTRPPDRVIIVDDGSTDGSIATLMSSVGGDADKSTPHPSGIVTRSEVLMQENRGAHSAINRAIAVASDCDFLAILNSDDCYHPRRIECCLRYLEDHPGVDLVCTQLRLIDAHGVPLPPEAPHARWFSAAWSFRAGIDDESPEALIEWLGLANFPGTTSNFFARADWLRTHPLAGFRYVHDYHALIFAALEGRLGILDEELLDYRIHDSNTIATEPEKLIREMLRINVDVARTIAPRLGSDPRLRTAFARYQRAAWNNVSAFRADLFNVMLVEALALLPPPMIEALLSAIDQFPEIRRVPNKALVNVHKMESAGLSPAASLADRFYELKAQLSGLRAGARPWAEYRQLQAMMLASRWMALGRLLGVTRPILRAGGKTAPEKMRILGERLARSWWVWLGACLQSPGARKLRAMGRQASAGASTSQSNGKKS